MNAQQVAERSAVYALQDVVAPVAGEAFDLLATAPQGVAKLRELILSLAVRGRLLPQDHSDEPASKSLARIANARGRLIADGAIKQHKQSGAIPRTDKPFESPAGWEWARLADLVAILNGRAYAKDELLDSGVPVLRVGNLFTSTHWYYSSLSLEPDKYCDAGDLLFAWSASFGPFIWPGPKAIYHYHIWKLNLHSDKDLDKRYLYTFLLKKTQEIKAAGHGVSMLHMTKEKMEKIIVPLPPLAEQRRIVARVEELMGLCDELETRGRLQDEQHARLLATLFDALVASASPAELADNWRRIARHFDLLLDRPEAVDALEQTILQLAVHGLLVPQDPADEPASELVVRIRAEKAQLIADGELSEKKLRDSEDHSSMIDLPHGWVSSSLAEIGIVNPRNTAQDDSIASFIPMNCVPIGLLDTHASEQRRWSEIKTGFTHFGEGDVGVAKITPCFENGKSTVFRNLTNGIGAGTTELHIVRPLGGVLPDYLLLFVKSPYFLRGGEAVMTGTAGQKRLPRSYFEGVPFPLPPIPEQGRIVARVKLLLTLCADLRQHLQQAQATQLNLADVLVARATA